MDEKLKAKLSRLPLAGPAAAWFFRSRLWRVYEHLDARQWTRLAAAITFTSFLALFPVLALGAAIGAALLTEVQLADVEEWLADQVPGISDQLDLQTLFDNAGAIGTVALLLLLPTGASWIDSLRGCLRTVWDLPEPEENAVLRKAKDVGVLAGLGGVALLSLAASALAVSMVRLAADRVDRGGGPAGPLLQVAVHVLAVAVTFLLLLYLLVWLPGVRPPRTAVIAACLMGAVGFELLKVLLSGYLTEIAARSLYGAFGVPIALLVWINLIAKLLLFCCAWTATAVSAEARPPGDAPEGDGGGGTPTSPPRAEPSRPQRP
ncbi:YihY/virulence factor BrkB family protein [Streptomyces sp. ACA25]|uniref:YihY/virulence factor BrkB family protein n=1 Tax=Streptomyces sp. ACA25 TaxID=3022596 RepID=UPI0023081F73|nr:YihY/virulence factor BrkB family protein [Streptomyces sp. ACA25]MDB1087080.1 YihY/virulence factor BrkB family protein [Streptomyces sp. ACA25]